MSLFEVTEYDREVYETQIRDFLPHRIIDIHTHTYTKATLGPTPENLRVVTWPSLVAAENPIEHHLEAYRLFFPGKEVSALSFASLAPNDDQAGANAYVARVTKEVGWPALYFAKPTQSAEELERELLAGGFLGIKGYLAFSPEYIPEAEIRVFDFFPKHQLKVIDKYGGIVMLHIPRNGRLKDPVNIAQIIELKQEFPNIRLIIAHIGRAYVPGDVGDAFKRLAVCKDLLFDFSANTSDFSMTKMLEAVGSERVFFGSDMPICRMRMRRIEENNTYINLVPPGLYGDVSNDPHMREVSKEEGERLTFFMYEEILAFKRAAANVGLTKADVGRAFFGNADALIRDVQTRLGRR